jgi:hypothetical protein
MNLPGTSIKLGVVLLGLLAGSTAVAGDYERLFNGKDLAGWTVYVDPKATHVPEKPWSVADGVLVCEGSAKGYLITEREYENYSLRLEWRWGEKTTRPGRYSSVFVHVTGPDKMLPKGLDLTLGADAAGQFWLVGGCELQVDRRRQDPKSERHFFAMMPHADAPIGQWNRAEIVCNQGSVRASINGHLVNEGKAASPEKGRILLLSEGAEILFRKIELKALDPNKP